MTSSSSSPAQHIPSTMVLTKDHVQINLSNAMRLLIELVENEEWHNALAWVNKIPIESIESAEYRGTYLWAKAKCLDFLGESINVESMYRECIELHRHGSDPFQLIRSLVSLSSFYCYRSKPIKAKPLLNEALHLVKTHEISGNIHISVLYTLGIMHGRLRQHRVALEFFNEIEQLIQQNRSGLNKGSYHMAIGYSLICTKQFGKAENHYLQAHALFTASSDLSRIGLCCTYLGIIYRELMRYYLSHQNLEQAMDIFVAHDMSDQVNKVKVEQIILFLKTNKYDLAKTICMDLLTNSQDTIRGEAHYLLSKIHYSEGNIEESLLTLEKALLYFQDNNHKWLADAISFRNNINLIL
ncbi:hypothetical protein POF51_29625 [Brevibacillus sp. AG]|uniref:tetratricopeptide repeat protein n=1 Tax=Brevibacillus sp. AG TaxID=3020891 RepID=UPI00232B20C4|nr:hypothetical protein [Brevibacillus sp. AG]MDC0764884.1 hypothetical protein [Brevibacillus sp. AG]